MRDSKRADKSRISEGMHGYCNDYMKSVLTNISKDVLMPACQHLNRDNTSQSCPREMLSIQRPRQVDEMQSNPFWFPAVGQSAAQ